MAIYSAPEGYRLDAASGLYYQEHQLTDERGNTVRHLIWFNADTGEYTQQSYPATLPTPKATAIASPPRRLRGIAAAAVAVVLLGGAAVVGVRLWSKDKPVTPESIAASAPAVSQPVAPPAADTPPVTASEQQAEPSAPSAGWTVNSTEQVSKGGLVADSEDWIFYADLSSGGYLAALPKSGDSAPVQLTDFPVANISLAGDRLTFTDLAGSYILRTDQYGEWGVWMLPAELQCVNAYMTIPQGDDRYVLGGRVYRLDGIERFTASGNPADVTRSTVAGDNGIYCYFVRQGVGGLSWLEQTFEQLPQSVSAAVGGGSVRLGTVRTTSPAIIRTATEADSGETARRSVTDSILRGIGGQKLEGGARATAHSVNGSSDEPPVQFGDAYCVNDRYTATEGFGEDRITLTDNKTGNTAVVDGRRLAQQGDKLYFIDNRSGMLMRVGDSGNISTVSNTPVERFMLNPTGDVSVLYYGEDGRMYNGLLSQNDYSQQYREADMPMPGGSASDDGYKLYPTPPESVVGEGTGNRDLYMSGNNYKGEYFNTMFSDGSYLTTMKDENGNDRWVRMKKDERGRYVIDREMTDKMPVYTHYDQKAALGKFYYELNKQIDEKFLEWTRTFGSDEEALREYLWKPWGVRSDTHVPSFDPNPEGPLMPNADRIATTKELLHNVEGKWMSAKKRANGIPVFTLGIDSYEDVTFFVRWSNEMYGDNTIYKCEIDFDGSDLALTLKDTDGMSEKAWVTLPYRLEFRLREVTEVERDGRRVPVPKPVMELTYAGDTVGELEKGAAFYLF